MPPKKKKTEPEDELPPVHAGPGCSPDCMLCPFGIVFATLKQAKPEVMEHLMKAGFELFQAFKVVVDQHAERWDQAERLQRIPIR